MAGMLLVGLYVLKGRYALPDGWGTNMLSSEADKLTMLGSCAERREQQA